MNAKQETKPIEQTAEYWLGRVAAIVRLEGSGRLTKPQAADEVKATINEMQQKQQTITKGE